MPIDQHRRCRRARSARPAGSCPRAPAAAPPVLAVYRSTAASRADNGHPEETLTRHQPISIPSGPRRGRECQWPQPGSPTSAREIRSHLCSAGAASIRSQQLAVAGLQLALLLQRQPRVGDPLGQRVAHLLQLARGRPPAARRDGRRPRCRSRAAEKPRRQSAESWCSRRPIWRRSSARARRSSPPTRSVVSISRSSRSGIRPNRV